MPNERRGSRSDFPPHGASRRGCHDGLPWLDSLSAFAAHSGALSRSGSRVLFMGNGVNENHWGAEGRGAAMKLSKTLTPLEPLKKKINVINGLFNKHSTGQGIHPAQTGQPAVRRADSEGRGHPLGHQRRPDDRQPHRPGHAAAEHRAGVRAADDRVPRDQLLDGVQLAHLVAERRLAGAERSLPGAGVRHPVREPRQPAQPQHPRPREGRAAGAEPQDQLDATRRSSTST